MRHDHDCERLARHRVDARAPLAGWALAGAVLALIALA